MIVPLKHPAFPKRLAALSVLVTVAILLSGYVFLRERTLQAQAEAEAQLTAIARLKTEMIANWRAERLADARSFSDSPSFIADVGTWLTAPQPGISADLVAHFQALQPLRQYRDIVLVDPAGQPRLSLSGRLEPPDAAELAALALAFDQAQPVFCDLHRNPAGTITLAVIAPLLGRPKADPIGAIVLTIEPYSVLYPLLQTWPVPSASSESLLVRREGDDVVWLNNLRYQSEAALSLRMPLSEREVPAVMAALGRQGVFEGTDYRGAPVYSALAAVSDSPWFLVAKVDTAEVLALLRLTTGLVLALMLGSLAGTVGFTWAVWQQAQKQYYRAVSDAEAAQLALTRHFEYRLKYANDIILLAAGDFHLVEVNDRALEAYGYSREEMLKLTLADLVASEDAGAYQERQRELQEKGSYVRAAWHQRRDGSVFPAEVSARMI